MSEKPKEKCVCGRTPKYSERNGTSGKWGCYACTNERFTKTAAVHYIFGRDLRTQEGAARAWDAMIRKWRERSKG